MNQSIVKHIFSAAVTGAVALAFTACGGAQSAAPAMTHVTQPAVISPANSITVRGTVESIESRNVYTMLNLLVDTIHAEAGDVVTAGQILARLDNGDLELHIAQQRATIEATRQSTENAVRETTRMLNEAVTNLSNNTNMHILTAEASLNAAATQLEIARQNHDNAVRDYQEGLNPHILAASSGLRAVSIELETMENTHANMQRLYEAGAASREDVRQSENALFHLRNQHSDAVLAYDNANHTQQRTLDQLRTALHAATTAQQNAQALLTAARSAANQEIDMLRGSLVSAEIAANTEPMELALQLLERQLEDSIITAPISGTVTGVFAREGSFAQGPLFVIDDTNNLRIMTSFREYDISRISVGMAVDIVSDTAGGEIYSGIITRINPAANPFSPVVEFEAEIAVESDAPSLHIGMNTRIQIELE